MHWRITVEAVDPTGEEYRKEFLVEKNLDELTDGRIGFSIDDGKTVMAEIQKAVVQRELELWVRYRRAFVSLAEVNCPSRTTNSEISSLFSVQCQCLTRA